MIKQHRQTQITKTKQELKNKIEKQIKEVGNIEFPEYEPLNRKLTEEEQTALFKAVPLKHIKNWSNWHTLSCAVINEKLNLKLWDEMNKTRSM